MGKIRLITDSASDINEIDEKKYDIYIIPFPVTIGNKSYLSRIDFDNERFYELIKEYPNEIPKTAQITTFQFDELFKEQMDAGYTDLIFVSINKNGSATNNNAVMAKEQFFDEHPEYKGKGTINVFDGIGYSGQYGYPVIKAAEMAKNGTELSEILNYLTDILPKRRIYFGIYELKYAAKSGRIPSAAALVGDALGVKPVMRICDNEIVTAVKCRGEKKLITKITEITKNEIEEGSEYQIVYGSDSEVKDDLAKKMTEAVGYPPTGFFQIGAAITANSGPRVVGTIFNIKSTNE